MPKQNRFFSFFAIIGTLFATWLWANNEVLQNYNLQLCLIIFVIFFFAKTFFPKKEPTNFLPEILAFTIILLLLLSSTGELQSPLFSLSYFLIFAAAFLLDAYLTLALSAGLFLFFFRFFDSPRNIIQIFSLVLTTPIALYFGKLYLEQLESQEKIKILKKQSKHLIAKNEQLSENLANEETNALLWLSLNFKNSLLKILHLTADLLTDLGHLTPTQKERLQSIHETAKEILKSGEKLKEKIDKETD